MIDKVLRVTDDVRRRPWPFANPLLPTRWLLPNLPQLFLSIFSFVKVQKQGCCSLKKIIYSYSRKLTESLKTFVNPLLPAWCCLTSFKFSFRSFFFRFFCLVSCFLSQFKRKSANYLLQICKRNVFFFKAQDETVN